MIIQNVADVNVTELVIDVPY